MTYYRFRSWTDDLEYFFCAVENIFEKKLTAVFINNELLQSCSITEIWYIARNNKLSEGSGILTSEFFSMFFRNASSSLGLHSNFTIAQSKQRFRDISNTVKNQPYIQMLLLLVDRLVSGNSMFSFYFR